MKETRAIRSIRRDLINQTYATVIQIIAEQIYERNDTNAQAPTTDREEALPEPRDPVQGLPLRR